MDEWRDELEFYYETRGTNEVIEKLNLNNAVMITGSSGIGKTATMKYVSLYFERKGYDIVLISSPNDIPHQRFPERKQLFIMDDIIGKYRVDSVAVELWRRLHDRLKVVFKDQNVKLLSTLRRQLYTDTSSILFPTVFNSTIVDLEAKDLDLSSTEKKMILEKYLTLRNITENFTNDEMLRICSCRIAFPLLCNLFTSNQKYLKMKSEFFRSPFLFFKKELNRLQKENKHVYCVLVIVVMFHLEELHTIFDINCEIENKVAYNKLLRACEVSENIGRRTLYMHLQSVAGTFVETTNIFKFQHDKLEETIACHFGSQFPSIMLQYCKLDFIRDRVRLTKMPTDDENILVLKQTSFDVFFKRVLDEIIKGKFRDILLSEPMQCDKFIALFPFYISKYHMHMKDIENTSCNETFLPPRQPDVNNSRVVNLANRFALLEELQNRKKLFIHWVAAMGSIQLFILLFKRPEKRDKHYAITELMHLAVSGENIDVVKLLIDEGVDVNSYDEFGIPLLCKIAGTNRCDIAEFLVDEGADVNQTDEVMGWTPCFVATWFNEAEMLTFLLSRGANIDIFDFQLRVPLVIAVTRNNTQAVSVLLKNGADIRGYIQWMDFKQDIPMNFNYVLEEALNINNPKIIKMLTKYMKGRNLIVTPFPVAIRRRDIMRKLVNIFLSEIKSDYLKGQLWNDFIGICEAIYNNDIPKLKNIFAKGELIDIYSFFRGVSSIKHRKVILSKFDDNYLRFGPLHVSAACDNTTAAEILIQNGADPFQRDVRGRTSLHFATSAAMLKILLSTSKEPHFSCTPSPFTIMKKVLKCCITFETVPLVFKSLVMPSNDLKVNVRDIKGNTPIHSIISRTLHADPNKCLDAVETLIDNGADINIRCNGGYLPIDFFKTVSLRFDQSVIDRGECLLGGHQNKSFMKKEKRYLGILAAIFLVLYIVFTINIAKTICIQKEKDSSSDKLNPFYFHCMGYIQIIYLAILHQYSHVLILFAQALLCSSVIIKPLRSDLYYVKLFIRFSEKAGIVCVLVRAFAFKLKYVYSTCIFFNVYCVLVCTFFSILLLPNQCRNQVYKYFWALIFVFKVIIVSYLSVWILYLMLTFETWTFSYNIVDEYFSLSELILFFIVKVLALYIYIRLFVFRLYLPLLSIVFQPVYLYRQYVVHLVSVTFLLFFFVEILLVPLTLIFCEIPNN